MVDSEEDKFKFESEFKLRVGGDKASFRTRGWWMVDGGQSVLSDAWIVDGGRWMVQKGKRAGMASVGAGPILFQ